ncbi:MAG: hypothetical protein ABFE13_01340 [Phycisphaerales bacterium]
MASAVDDMLNDLIARVGRVRGWLLALSALRIAAVGLACVSAYVGLYAWLDHHVHFGTLGRVLSLLLFVAMIAVGLYCIVRVLRRDMTYARAANYIEGRHSFDQQLVAAVEYYEGKGDYPYSRALAGQLVQQVDRVSQGYRFDSTIERWQGYLLSGFILLCVCVVGLFVRQNVLYLSSYLGRLVRPFSAIEPIPATVLESATEDIVAGVDAPVKFDVGVEGRVPEAVSLVLTQRDPNDANEPPREIERVEMTRSTDAEGKTRFTATKSFDATSRFEYRFETPDARSDSHSIRVCETPSIERVTAKVFPPAQEGMPPVQPYEQEVTDQPLAVLPHSRVEFTAQASVAMREAVVVGPDGQARTQSLDGADSFGFEVTADRSSSLQISGTSTDGLASADARELQIVLKSDEPPQFKLLSPQGDYLTTDVASVPIVFDVTDDFGLDDARLVCELPGREPVVLACASPGGARQCSLTHILELEQYELHVGDGILFYATARDVRTGQGRSDPNACSEIYFIEIRAYRQYWHVQAGGKSQSPMPMPTAEDLITILEYTRAVVKKTWVLARSPGVPEEDRRKMEALAGDVQYCATRLTSIRDDPDAGFGEGEKAVMNVILRFYEQARERLDARDAGGALPPAQEAYRILRMFIDEMNLKWSPPDNSPSVPEEKPERIKLQEQPQEPKMEKERIESQLKEIQQKIDSLSQQQESLKADAAKALEQDKEANAASKEQEKAQASQQKGDFPGSDGTGEQGEQSGGAQGGQSGDQQGKQSAIGQSGQPGKSQSGQSGEGQSGQSGNGQGEQPGESQTGQPRSGQDGQSGKDSRGGQSAGDRQGKQPGAGQGGESDQGRSSEEQSPSSSGDGAGRASAQRDARMRMLQAKQKALREQASELSDQIGGLPTQEYSDSGRTSRQAKEHLDQAVEAMKQFEDRLGDARYESLDSADAVQMTESAESASRRLADAGQAIQRGLAGEGQDPAGKAQEMAEQLAKDAEAYEESLTEAQKQKMMERLEAAQRLLESMAGPQWATMSSGGGPGAGHVYTKDPHATAADTARLLARQFWSVALEAKKRQSRSVEEEASDVEFFEAENDFFEAAARFKSQGVAK